MQNSLYPREIIGHTSEEILTKDSAKGHIIYCIIVASVLMTFILLPIIRVKVSVQSNGIIRPITEKNSIRLMSPGTITNIFVKENQIVNKGQILLTLNSDVLDEKTKYTKSKINEQKDYIHDLELLTAAGKNLLTKTFHFNTKQYKNEYQYFKNQIVENQFKHEKAKKEFERYKYMHTQNAVSLSELEYKELEASQLAIKHNMLTEQQLESWHKELISCQLKLKELILQQEQTKKEKEFMVIKSPITGTLEQFSGISVGSFVQQDQVIAVISPRMDLIAEVYVSPRDIGFLGIGNHAKIQIDTFNYNQWGFVDATIDEISDDFIMIDKVPVFRIKCVLEKNYLQLKNGFKGNLKKGMTFRARFLITERTLFQLLYDRIDDWFNPLQKRE